MGPSLLQQHLQHTRGQELAHRVVASEHRRAVVTEEPTAVTVAPARAWRPWRRRRPAIAAS